MNYEKLHVDRDWILSHLPAEISSAAGAQELDFSGYYQDGLSVLRERERSNNMDILYTARDEEDLRIWTYMEVCDRIAEHIEILDRVNHAHLWRYDRLRVKHGHWIYKERKHYKYDAIFDTRLDYFERYLRYISAVVPADCWEREIRCYVGLMNRWYREPHWDYDRTEKVFIEVNDNREYASDNDPREVPEKENIVRGLFYFLT